MTKIAKISTRRKHGKIVL